MELSNQALPLEGVRLLLVDDQVDITKIVTWILEDAGAEVVAVHSAEEALRAVEGFIPDILISDICLPDMNGHLLLQHLRERIGTLQLGPTQDIPAIALSGYSNPSLDNGSSQGAVASFQKYLAKPFDLEELVRLVAELSQAQSKVQLVS
ncbi:MULTISPECIES: response regulator [Trichocoleus]|uniref:Response regulator n=1 Tax=Trichocoleus desertorum GB2-A4 TaxID=2933944 RepID=A0ABV0JGE9_9CYAN|nr:response regulator [Trichocoleus sp. FACHB-46]MBD1865285.1 response regulator [Trichocoleus sp. FACHB-46]